MGSNQTERRTKISTTQEVVFCPLYSHREGDLVRTQPRITSIFRGTKKLLMKLGAKEREPIKYQFSYISVLWKEGYEIGHQSSEARKTKTLEDIPVTWFGFLPFTR